MKPSPPIGLKKVGSMTTFAIFILCLLPSMVMAGNFVTYQEFQQFSPSKQVEVFSAYKDFVQAAVSQEEMGNFSATVQFSFMEKAYAASKFNCFYAGWPSIKKSVITNGKTKYYCSSPLTSNPQYKGLAVICSKGQMLCEPVLFGANICIENKTQAQKNSAFSQCQTKFIASGKSLSDLVQETSTTGLKPMADEMFALVHDVCEVNTFQSKKQMCLNLKNKIQAIKEIEIVKKPDNVEKNPVIVNPPINTDLPEQLIQAVNKVNETIVPAEINPSLVEKCEDPKIQLPGDLQPYEVSEAIDQNKVTPKDFCAGSQPGTKRVMKSTKIPSDSDDDALVEYSYQQEGDDEKTRLVGRYKTKADKMGTTVPYVDEGVEYGPEDHAPMSPIRSFTNIYDGRGKENSFDIEEIPFHEEYNNKLTRRYYTSESRITNLAFFPRKNVPSIKQRDGKIIMKLTTGEELIINQKTNRVIEGVVKEVPAKNPLEVRGLKKVIYPDTDISYQGEGLYIETKITAKDQRKPGNLVAVKALVDGKVQVCKLKSEDIWQRNYGYYLKLDQPGYLNSVWDCRRFKFQKDEELYSLIKKSCPSFKFPPLAK